MHKNKELVTSMSSNTTRRQKLLIASDCFLPRWDGIARFLSEVVPRLSSTYDITLLVPNFAGEKVNWRGIRIVYFPVTGIKFGDFPMPSFQWRKVTKEVADADIIFTQTIGPIGVLAIRAAAKQHKPAVCFIHSIEWELVPSSIQRFRNAITEVTRSFCRRFYNKASLLLVPSQDTAQKLGENYVAARKHVVHLGVNASQFTPAKDKAAAKKAVHLPQDGIIIGFSGRVAREKDLPTLYRAFRMIKMRYANTNLLVIGKGLPLSEVFPSRQDIIHVPQANDIHRYLQAMDVYVMPSLTETSSLSTLEAMACGIPVIATPVGHLKHYIVDGKNGFLFNKGNPTMLAKKLAMLIEDAKLRKAIGEEARRTVTAKYSWDKTAKEIMEELGEF